MVICGHGGPLVISHQLAPPVAVAAIVRHPMVDRGAGERPKQHLILGDQCLREAFRGKISEDGYEAITELECGKDSSI
jgi:hypothetical protein